MKQKLVGLLGGGFTIIAGDGHQYVIRDKPSLHALEPRKELPGDRDRVGAFAFGESYGHRRLSIEHSGGVARKSPAAMAGFGRAGDHAGDVLDIDRTPVAGGDKKKAYIGHAL